MIDSIGPCIILGGGGHARMLIEILVLNKIPIIGVLDNDPNLIGKYIQGIPILGSDQNLPELRSQATHFVIGIGGVGDNYPRKRLYDYAISHGLYPITVAHSSSIISRWVKFGRGCQFMPGCIINSGAILGDNVIVNSGAIIEHDCSIGNHVHIATGARLAGAVQVDDLAHIGAGATIRQCVKVGAKAIVGAGAVVVKDVTTCSIVVGVPAKELRKREKRTYS